MKIPTLEGWVTPDGVHVCVWCDSCYKWHWHGHGQGEPIGAGDGHRGAHCLLDDSLYQRTGYYVKEVGVWTASEERAALSGKDARAIATLAGLARNLTYRARLRESSGRRENAREAK